MTAVCKHDLFMVLLTVPNNTILTCRIPRTALRNNLYRSQFRKSVAVKQSFTRSGLFLVCFTLDRHKFNELIYFDIIFECNLVLWGVELVYKENFETVSKLVCLIFLRNSKPPKTTILIDLKNQQKTKCSNTSRVSKNVTVRVTVQSPWVTKLSKKSMSFTNKGLWTVCENEYCLTRIQVLSKVWITCKALLLTTINVQHNNEKLWQIVY